jgi:hypothetical protein
MIYPSIQFMYFHACMLVLTFRRSILNIYLVSHTHTNIHVCFRSVYEMHMNEILLSAQQKQQKNRGRIIFLLNKSAHTQTLFIHSAWVCESVCRVHIKAQFLCGKNICLYDFFYLHHKGSLKQIVICICGNHSHCHSMQLNWMKFSVCVYKAYICVQWSEWDKIYIFA